ncbi:MAG: hypothetical protein QMD50_02030 [Patescibacteria group bacterium]|nr:hypothetical protein [Patescibacteria group bacterium]
MNKDYSCLKKNAIKLRKSGRSYNEIKKKINVSKSTLSLWLKNIPLSLTDKKRFYTKQIQILSLGPKSQKERRAREIEKIIFEAEREINLPLNPETYRLMGASLYWAEGSKGKRFVLTNSDPHLILFIVKWIEKILKISPNELILRLNIYPQQNEMKIKKFWSDLTNIPIKNFGKSYIKPTSTNFKQNNLYFGTIRVEIPKSANIQHQIFGWIKAAIKDIDPNVKFVQNKWRILKETKKPVNL